MLKKSLLLGALLSFQSLNAFTLVQKPFGVDAVQINPNFKNAGRTDWIGVYPKGSSTAWGNVIQWQFVKDLFDKKYTIPALKPGDYEIRYFKDNSYVISDSYSFHIGKKQKVFAKLHEYKNGSVVTRLNIDHAGEKDWIAYYKKGTSTAWKNVLKWHWVKDLDCVAPDDCHDVVPLEELALGQYELRYFKNNSYSIYGEPLNINIKKVPSTLEKINVSIEQNTHNIFVDFNGIGNYLKPNPKDWVALYPVGSTNAWENVVQWIWAKDATHKSSIYSSFKMNNLKPDMYEIRYFLNNSFSTYVTSKSFTIK